MSTIITSIITSTVVASIVAGIFMIIKTNLDYKNDFYKTILQKRIETYESIEQLLGYFSTAVVDYNDKRMYHIIFSEKENPLPNNFYILINKLNKSNIWVSERTSQSIAKLNKYIIENKIDFMNLEDGKNHYGQLGFLRDEILINTKNDLAYESWTVVRTSH